MPSYENIQIAADSGIEFFTLSGMLIHKYLQLFQYMNYVRIQAWSPADTFLFGGVDTIE